MHATPLVSDFGRPSEQNHWPQGHPHGQPLQQRTQLPWPQGHHLAAPAQQLLPPSPPHKWLRAELDSACMTHQPNERARDPHQQAPVSVIEPSTIVSDGMHEGWQPSKQQHAVQAQQSAAGQPPQQSCVMSCGQQAGPLRHKQQALTMPFGRQQEFSQQQQQQMPCLVANAHANDQQQHQQQQQLQRSIVQSDCMSQGAQQAEDEASRASGGAGLTLGNCITFQHVGGASPRTAHAAHTPQGGLLPLSLRGVCCLYIYVSVHCLENSMTKNYNLPWRHPSIL